MLKKIDLSHEQRCLIDASLYSLRRELSADIANKHIKTDDKADRETIKSLSILSEYIRNS